MFFKIPKNKLQITNKISNLTILFTKNLAYLLYIFKKTLQKSWQLFIILTMFVALSTQEKQYQNHTKTKADKDSKTV